MRTQSGPHPSDTQDIEILPDLLYPEKMTWAAQIVMVMALGLAHQTESQRAWRSVVDDRHDRWVKTRGGNFLRKKAAERLQLIKGSPD